MRVKAFSLMELIVVIILLGIISVMVLSSIGSKKEILKSPDIKELPKYIKKLKLKDDAVFYIYGDKCENSILLCKDKDCAKNINVPFKKSYKTLKTDSEGVLKQADFLDIILSKKRQHVCFKLDILKGRFSDKLILNRGNTSLLFLPIYQEIKEFNTLQKAQKRYFDDDLLPKSEDDYYKR